MLDLEKAELCDIIVGYKESCEGYTCLWCGSFYEKGQVYKLNGKYYDAKKAVKLHMDNDHCDRLCELLESESKYLSLTENQQELFKMFKSGLSDSQIAKALCVAPSTVRHQKFVFRERAKAAKLYLAAWSLAETTDNLIPVHKGAKMVDERYVITQDEREKILENVFDSLEPLKLKVFSKKEKKKIVILSRIAGEFKQQQTYTEKEVNEVLKEIYEDFATLRRYLVEYGYMERTRDGKSYWLK